MGRWREGERERKRGGRGGERGQHERGGGNLKILFSSALYMQMLTLQCQRAAVTLEAPTSLDHSHHCCKTHTHTNTHAHTHTHRAMLQHNYSKNKLQQKQFRHPLLPDARICPYHYHIFSVLILVYPGVKEEVCVCVCACVCVCVCV